MLLQIDYGVRIIKPTFSLSSLSAYLATLCVKLEQHSLHVENSLCYFTIIVPVTVQGTQSCLIGASVAQSYGWI